MKNMKIIGLTGGAGYIGSVLARKLLQNGYEVIILDGFIYKNYDSLAGLLENSSIRIINADVRDEKKLKVFLSKCDIVVWLAALVGDPICKKYPELSYSINYQATKRGLEFANDFGIKKFIFASTCSNYGLREEEEPADEDAELAPLSVYAETKVEVEKFIIENEKDFRFEPVILRLSTAFGISYRMRFDLTVSEFTRELALGKELVIYDEKTWRPYCHVEDISEAIIRCIEIERGNRTRIYNVGGDENNYTKEMIVKEAIEVTGNNNVKFKKGGVDKRNYRVSFQKIRNEIGFKTKRKIKDSIESLTLAIRNGFFMDVEERKIFYGNYYIHEDNIMS